MDRISIIGAGTSGSYFYALAKDHFDVTVYDRDKAARGHSCAWGTFADKLKTRLAKVGLDYEDYVLSRVNHLILNGIRIKIRNEVCIDKPRLLRDLLPDKEIKKRNFEDLGRRPAKGTCINATSHPFGAYKVIKTKQYKVTASNLEPNTAYIHIDPKLVGYAWAFSLDEEGVTWHLGAGCVNDDPELLIEQFKKRYSPDLNPIRHCSCDRGIKVCDPKNVVLTRPLGYVAIGEAAGIVYPISGEGIIPSMDSADILYRCIYTSDLSPYTETYEREMKYMMKNYLKPYNLWTTMHTHPRWSWIKGFNQMIRRAQGNINPELNANIKLRLMKEILFG